jgi:hypothetical protein
MLFHLMTDVTTVIPYVTNLQMTEIKFIIFQGSNRLQNVSYSCNVKDGCKTDG